MKIKITIVFVALLILSGCKKYLDVQPKDLKLATTVKDYQDLLNGEGWGTLLSGAEFYWLDMMTDDVGEALATTTVPIESKLQYSHFYVWSNNPDFTYIENGESGYNIKTWTWLYHIVNISNIILEDLDNVKAQTENERLLLRSETLFSRALAYYYILNIWGEPYDPSTANSAKGVPLKTTPFPQVAGTGRSSVQQGYDLILSDLNEAETILADQGVPSSGSVFHVSKDAVEILLSRVYLYMQNWEKAKEYADKAIATRPGLFDITTENLTTTAGTNFFNPRTNEVVFTYHKNDKTPFGTNYVFGAAATGSVYTVSSEMVGLYSAGLNSSSVDKRKNGFIQVSSNRNFAKTMLQEGSSFATPTTKLYDYDIRVAEAYLNRAEAQAQLGNTTQALSDINFLRSKRITGTPTVTITDQAQMIAFIYEERRRELFFQGHRWFDLRRTTRPSITHFYTPVNGTGSGATIGTQLKFILLQNDPGYTVEIPFQERELNTAITALALPERLPQ